MHLHVQVSALSSQLYELQAVSEKRLAAAAAEAQAALRAERLELQVRSSSVVLQHDDPLCQQQAENAERGLLVQPVHQTVGERGQARGPLLIFGLLQARLHGVLVMGCSHIPYPACTVASKEQMLCLLTCHALPCRAATV